jgi:RNA polymerase sigma factor (sigma-70 family)
MPGISEFLRRVVVSELRGESDAALLGRFLTQRDEAAFTAIVRRHGAMVYHVCRGVLQNAADAEDASQATFLVLAQKAAQVRKQGSLSSWLHGVALRISHKLRASIARRRAGEAQLSPPPPAHPDDLSIREARVLLHEELDRLPARYKDPLVLCYLQGKTHDEAAAELGWTLPVFRGRLERARKHLHSRLGRRGLTLTAALITGVLAEAQPALATTFAVATARAAAMGSQAAAARGLVSPLIVQLTQEILGAMTLSPLKMALPLLAALAVAAGGYLTYRAVSAPPAELPQKANAKDPRQALPADLRERILACKFNRFARLGPNLDLTGLSKELEGYGFILRHRISPDGKSVAFKHQTIAGEVLSLWKFGQAWPGKVIWARRELLSDFFWMPDGKQLVLCGYRAIKNELPDQFIFQTLDVATREVAELKLPDGHWLTDISPDGKWFLTMKHTDPKAEAQVHRVERSNGEARKLFDGGTVHLPQWRISPDGSRIAGIKLGNGRIMQLFVGDAKDRTLRQVTHEDHHAYFYGWSPDGRKLLYQLTRKPPKPKGGDAYHQVIATIGADGNNRIELLDNEGHFDDQGRMHAEDIIGWADWR